MTIVLKMTWTALVLVAVVALSIGLSKTGYFELSVEARIEEPRGRRIVAIASVALLAVGIAAVPVLRAPKWTVILVLVISGLCVWIVHSDWWTPIALAIVYPLSVIIIVGYWVPRTCTL